MKNLVEQATSDILANVDWGANMSLVDEINSTRDAEILREIVRLIRKRLQAKEALVVMTALTLTETCVKNCHSVFHREVATEKFLEAIAKIARVSGQCVLLLAVLFSP